MDDDGVHADELEQYHVSSEAVLQRFVEHRAATVFDNQPFAVQAPNIGEGIEQDLCLGDEVSYLSGGPYCHVKDSALARTVYCALTKCIGTDLHP